MPLTSQIECPTLPPPPRETTFSALTGPHLLYDISHVSMFLLLSLHHAAPSNVAARPLSHATGVSHPVSDARMCDAYGTFACQHILFLTLRDGALLPPLLSRSCHFRVCRRTIYFTLPDGPPFRHTRRRASHPVRSAFTPAGHVLFLTSRDGALLIFTHDGVPLAYGASYACRRILLLLTSRDGALLIFTHDGVPLAYGASYACRRILLLTSRDGALPFLARDSLRLIPCSALSCLSPCPFSSPRATAPPRPVSHTRRLILLSHCATVCAHPGRRRLLSHRACRHMPTLLSMWNSTSRYLSQSHLVPQSLSLHFLLSSVSQPGCYDPGCLCASSILPRPILHHLIRKRYTAYVAVPLLFFFPRCPSLSISPRCTLHLNVQR
ncbi:hypothetical protein R3P38DRAFT_1967939 [Favolaschia claudopus]|uniref:Uncharacterized protein n=1 Tax=Favolaschia claudopus TaxID=2862362 RepID=A0AAV9ZYK7_9AGAR